MFIFAQHDIPFDTKCSFLHKMFPFTYADSFSLEMFIFKEKQDVFFQRKFLFQLSFFCTQDVPFHMMLLSERRSFLQDAKDS